MEAFFTYVVKNLVDNPDSVRVAVEESSEGMKVVVLVPSEDMSKVVGRKGRIVYALRTIGRSVGARLGHRVRVEVQELGQSSDRASDEDVGRGSALEGGGASSCEDQTGCACSTKVTEE